MTEYITWVRDLMDARLDLERAPVPWTTPPLWSAAVSLVEESTGLLAAIHQQADDKAVIGQGIGRTLCMLGAASCGSPTCTPSTPTPASTPGWPRCASAA